MYLFLCIPFSVEIHCTQGKLLMSLSSTASTLTSRRFETLTIGLFSCCYGGRGLLPCRIQCRINSSTSSLCGYRTVQFVVIEVMKRQDAQRLRKSERRDEGRKRNHDKSHFDLSGIKNHQ